MKRSTDIGLNRTGVDMSPVHSKEMMDASQKYGPSSQGDEMELARIRAEYIREAQPVGTIPIPGSMKGAASTAAQKLMGKQPGVLIDRLGDRLAFERTGTRLYEALIQKCQIAGSAPLQNLLPELVKHRDEEARHFALVRDTMKMLGADPTAQTPSADVSGVASMGLLQVVCDPRTSLMQSLDAILIAELADNDGWEMLIRLTDQMGLKDTAASFRKALEEERDHLACTRAWLNEMLTMTAEAKAA